MAGRSPGSCTLKKAFAFAMLGCLVGACAHQAAPSQSLQPGELPSSLSGRWRWPADSTQQVFSLDEIRAQPDRTFTAKLTWWQVNPWCAWRDLPIVGRQTDEGIAFEVPRMCGIAYVAELRRSPSGWVGQASSMSGYGLYLELKAN